MAAELARGHIRHRPVAVPATAREGPPVRLHERRAAGFPLRTAGLRDPSRARRRPRCAKARSSPAREKAARTRLRSQAADTRVRVVELRGGQLVLGRSEDAKGCLCGALARPGATQHGLGPWL